MMQEENYSPLLVLMKLRCAILGLVNVTFINRHGNTLNQSSGIVLILLSLIEHICGDVETSELCVGQTVTLIINC